MRRLASVRFDRVLTSDERAEVEQSLSSVGASATSWIAPVGFGRTYARLELGVADAAPVLRAHGAQLREPPALVLEIVPREALQVASLAAALAGPGGLAGVLDCHRNNEALLVELDEARTPLALLVDLVDVELAPTPGRRIRPLLGLCDESLARFAGAVLQESDLDATRLIENYTRTLRPAVVP